MGSAPYETLRVGTQPDCPLQGDPLAHLERVLASHRLLPVPSVKLPPFTGGAVGYVAYDAVAHFEPRTAPYIAAQEDALALPESIFMLCDDLVVFDHVRHTIKVVAHCRVPPPPPSPGDEESGALEKAYASACARIDALCTRLAGPLPASFTQRGSASMLPAAAPPPPTPTRTPLPAKRGGAVGAPAEGAQPPAPSSPSLGGGMQPLSSSAPSTSSSSSSSSSGEFDWEAGSNVGRTGYEGMVTSLQSHITEGDIIQAVPSQRISRPLPPGVTAFDVYRHLRVVNPSPYMFYLELGPDFQVREGEGGCCGVAGGEHPRR